MAFPELTLQASLKGITIAFQQTVDGKTADYDAILDRWTKAVARQKAKIDIGEKTLAMKIAEQQIKSQAEERVRQYAQFEAQHAASGRRGDFRLSQAQQQVLANIDQNMARFKSDIPIFEEQIARLRELIGEIDPTEAALLAEAAD